MSGTGRTSGPTLHRLFGRYVLPGNPNSRDGPMQHLGEPAGARVPKGRASVGVASRIPIIHRHTGRDSTPANHCLKSISTSYSPCDPVTAPFGDLRALSGVGLSDAEVQLIRRLKLVKKTTSSRSTSVAIRDRVLVVVPNEDRRSSRSRNRRKSIHFLLAGIHSSVQRSIVHVAVGATGQDNHNSQQDCGRSARGQSSSPKAHVASTRATCCRRRCRCTQCRTSRKEARRCHR